MSRLALLAVLVCAACDDAPDHAVRVAASYGAAAPAYGDVPFPTDGVVDGGKLGTIAGLDAISSTYADLIAAHVATLDGWGLRPVVEFPLTGGAIDATALPATATTATTDPIFVIALDGSNAVVPFEWRYDEARAVIAGHPLLGSQLKEGVRYAAVVTTGVQPLAPLGTIAAADRWQTTIDARTQIEAMLAPHAIAGIAVFTTGHHGDVLVKARAAMDAPGVPKPSLVFDNPAIVFDSPAKLQALLGDATTFATGNRAGQEHWGGGDPNGIARAHIGVVATGKFSIVRFRGDDTHTDGPEDETFQLDASGAPKIVAQDETIPLTVILPKAPAPASGYPVVIFAHGLGSSRIWALNLAEPLTAAGYAVVAIDIFGHGSRYSAADVRNNLGTKSGFTGVKTMPDGFGDDVGQVQVLDFFEGFLNISAIRDSLRQSALDFTRVAELVHAPLDLSALAGAYGGMAPKLDPTKIAFLGESLGTIVGSDVAAISSDLLGLFVLDVPGGGLLDEILPNSPAVSTLALSFISTAYATHGAIDRFHPLVGMLQAVFDPGDPLTFAPRTDPATAVLVIEVVGDETMSNPSTIALAHGFGAKLLAPSYDATGFTEVASPVTGVAAPRVIVQYAPASHGLNWSAEHGTLSFVPGFPHDGDDPFPQLPAPITIGEPIYETMDQVTQLLNSYRAGAPTIVSTLAPRHDFDDDGKPDDTDPAPFDPTR